MKSVLTAATALLLFSSPAAFAQNVDNHGIQLTQYENRDRDRDQNEVRGTPHWNRGDRLPGEFRGGQYMAQDWQAMHLKRPARGYHWVHVGDRYLLVADRTGLIRDMRLEAELRH